MTFTVKDILKMEVAPALGCTEPVAVALGGAAAAALIINDAFEAIEVWVDPNIYKNALAVSIPGTEGLRGLDLAVTIGALGGNPKLGLEVLNPVDTLAVQRALAFLKNNSVTVNLLEGHKGIHIRTVIHAGGEIAESVIKDGHANIVSLSLNQTPILDHPLLKTGERGASDLASLEDWLKQRSLSELLEFVYDLDEKDLAFLEEGIHVNMKLADYGLKYGPGLGIGKALDRLTRQKLLRKDMILMARMLTSAAADTRMAGIKLPAMSSAGSGNHGLTAILPIWAVREFVDYEMATMLEAIGLSHIITGYIKAYTGRLSAVCGCSVAAGAGAAAGLTYLLGGNPHNIAGAIKNLTVDLAGVICDGAKPGCALKLATAAGNAVQAALFSLQGIIVEFGISGASPEETMRNIGTLSTQGMIETDRTILNIMLEKKFSGI